MELRNVELFEKYQSIIKKVIPKDRDIKSIIKIYNLLEDYRFIITDIINRREFLEMLKNQSSETYLDTYKKKGVIIMKEMEKFEEKFEESINISEEEILKNLDSILKYPRLTVSVFKNNRRLFNSNKDKILRSVLVKNPSKKEKFNHSLLMVGIDYDLSPGNIEKLPDSKDIIIFHNNMKLIHNFLVNALTIKIYFNIHCPHSAHPLTASIVKLVSPLYAYKSTVHGVQV